MKHKANISELAEEKVRRKEIEETLDELENYLSSSVFHQIGPKTARKIVSTLGIRTIRIIEKSPKELYEIRDIGRRRVSSIVEGWATQRRLKKECMVLMQEGGEKNETGNRE